MPRSNASMNVDFEESKPVITDEVNYFTVPPVNIVSDKITWVDTQPSYITNDGQKIIYFDLNSSSSRFVDLSKTELKVKLRIIDPLLDVKNNVFKQESGHTALPIDNFLHSMWKSVDVKIGGTLVSTTGTEYMYKAFFENLLSYGENAKRIQMSLIGFTGESGDFSNTNPETQPLNTGLAQRMDWFRPLRGPNALGPEEKKFSMSPKVVEFSGKLCADICNQDRLILSKCRIYISLFPSSDQFRLITCPDGTVAKVEIEDVRLSVCKVQVDPRVLIGISKGLELKPALYPFRKSEIRTHNINVGAFSAYYEDQFQTLVPNRLIIGLVKAGSFAGDFSTNPLMFEDFGLSQIGFYVDNEPIPGKPIEINFEEGQYLEGLMSLYRVSGKLNENTDLGITRSSYREGYALFGFEVNPSTSDNDFLYLGKTQRGTTKIDLKFHKALPEAVTVVIYATFPEIMEIDQARVVRLRNKSTE